MIQVAIEPKTKVGQEKMTLALIKLAEEDPTFKTYTDPQTGQTIIAGMGELHLEIIVDRLLREFKVEATVGKPQVAYRETIRREAEGEGRYVRQTGGHGQFGHCKIRIEPAKPGEGYSFESKIVGGAIPREFITPIDTGIKEASQSGIVGGFEVVDFKATVLDGSYHEVDSSEIAFKIAGSMAFKDALRKADPCLMEPTMKVEVIIPEQYMGDVIGDLTGRRGRIEGMEARPGRAERARVRAAERDVRLCDGLTQPHAGPRAVHHAVSITTNRCPKTSPKRLPVAKTYNEIRVWRCRQWQVSPETELCWLAPSASRGTITR